MTIRKHLPRRGMAEQRQFLLDSVQAPYALFLDDDVILEPDLLGRLVDTIAFYRCGFVGPTSGADNLTARCTHDHSFVADVPVHAVLEQALALFAP